MIKPQLIEYIQQQSDQGFSADAISNALLTQGWSPEEIQEAFSSFEVDFVDTPQPTETSTIVNSIFAGIPDEKRQMLKLAAAAIIFIFAVLIYFSVQKFSLIGSTRTSEFPEVLVEEEPLSITESTSTPFVADDVN